MRTTANMSSGWLLLMVNRTRRSCGAGFATMVRYFAACSSRRWIRRISDSIPHPVFFVHGERVVSMN